MIEMQAPVIIGGREYKLTVTGETMEEIVRQIGPWQDIEKHAKPDCVFSYRRSPDGQYEFYSLYSAKDNTELPLGVRKNPKGNLFAGKICKEGGSKRVIVEWKQVLSNSPIVDDEEGQQGQG